MSAPDPTAKPLRVLSLGAGVQSTTLLLMSVQGELEPLDAAIFADTGWEPAAVYRHLQWLEAEVGTQVPIHRVSAGNLASEIRRRINRETAYWTTLLPFYVRGPDGRRSMLPRQCTANFKIRPIRRELRRITGRGPRTRNGPHVEQWIGISLDEYQRMRTSDIRWVMHRYPLVERRMTRGDCLLWLERQGYPQPPKSACLGCPFHDNRGWRHLRDTSPVEWAEVVAFDAAVRQLPHLTDEAFLHGSCQRLAEVDLSTREDHGQLRLPELCDGGHCFT